ncbi:MAG: S9 family peptidase [Candidatus Koribacter versatilis]|uniref:S9 family peptidase n=1 Tax=Candidatus Korobacter versatilis TaxID=658062 RepID=A0A932A9U2_9BACT|nr:S9 family peptidase [Candidatus Koribacter versatilis]
MRRLIVCLLLASTCFAQTQKRPFTFTDMMALKRVGEPVPSPDGRWVAFSAVEVDLAANKKTSHIWIVPIAGGESKKITNDAAGEDRPRWSPDGKKLAFLWAKDGGTQVWVQDFDSAAGALTGEPKKVTSISTEADGESWSPDGKWILFTSGVYPECKDDACNKEKDEARTKSKVKAAVFTELFYRHWNAYRGPKRSHLFVVSSEGGTARDLTPGKYDVPPFSLGGQDDYAWSPDSKEVCYSSNHDAVEATSTNPDLFTVEVQSGKTKQLTTNKGSDSTPLYSPDGKYIAYRAQFRGGYESDRFRLMLYDRASGKSTNLTEKFDRWVGTYTWRPDSKFVYFSAQDKGESPIYMLGTGSGPVVDVVTGHNDDLAVTANGKTLLFTQMSATSPTEVYEIATRGLGGNLDCLGPKVPKDTCIQHPDQGKQLTHMNDAVLSQVAMQPLEPFWFTGSMGKKVEGFIVKPPDFGASKKYPVKFLIHGGPQGAWGDSWSYRWNAELFAASGYVVVMINPRGSTGYGQAFIDDINGDWGGKAYQDLMLGLDYVQAKYPYIDKTRTCAMGASFGGYMVNWIMGHTGRFQCIVSHDGIFNTESAYGDTEELWFPEWEFKGTPWTNRALYQRESPHMYATQIGRFKTPTLVVHGQLDYRLDVSQGFDLFTTLQRLKVPSKMLYFPDEGHWVLKPQNSQLWYETVNGWVDEHLKKK